MITQLKRRVRETAQRFALGGIGAIMGMAGVGFLSASALLFLLSVTDPITATAVMGGAFLGVGLLMMVAARSSGTEDQRMDARQAPAQTEDMPPLAAAFMHGMAQGMAQGRRH